MLSQLAQTFECTEFKGKHLYAGSRYYEKAFTKSTHKDLFHTFCTRLKYRQIQVHAT